MSKTTNLGLELTPEEDTTTTFKDWRLSINGESNSNMIKIDNAYSGLGQMVCGIYDGVDLSVKFADEIANYTNVWLWIQARIQSGTYDGIYIGDYIPFVCHNNTYNAVVAGINTYKGYGDSGHVVGNHIDFVCDKLWDASRRFNRVDYNNGIGTNALAYPWLSSDIYYWINGLSGTIATAVTVNESTKAVSITTGQVAYTQTSGSSANRGLYNYLPAALQSVIAEKRFAIPARFVSGTAMTDNTGAAFQSIGKLWFPTEVEVFGCSIWAAGGYSVISGAIQYPLFKSESARIKTLNGTTTRSNWWLLDAANLIPTERYNYERISCVMNDGRCSPVNTNNAGPPGIPICFRIA